MKNIGLTGAVRGKFLILALCLLPATLCWLSCGGSSAPNSITAPALKYRALLSNNVSAGTLSAGIFVVNAAVDERANVAPIAAGNNPGMMVETPNLGQTLVFSGIGTQASDNQFTVIDNATQSAAGHVILPGTTQSFVVSPDSSTVYVAVPNAPVVGSSPGVVDVISLPPPIPPQTGSSGPAFTGEVDVPSVQYLAIDNSGNRLLGFSPQASDPAVADAVAIITPSNIGIPNANPVSYIGGVGVFDHPVAAFFSTDDSTAYVLSCGAECGGTQASLQQFNVNTNTLVASVPLCVPSGNPVQPCASLAAGSVALINGSTLYVAGTPPYSNGAPSQPCTGQTTSSTSCGLLFIVNLTTMSVTNTAPIIITDGYHNRLALGPNGQLYIGAHGCTEILAPIPPPPGAEVRGCLAIYNTLPTAVGSAPAGGVLIPPANGDATGLQPIAVRGSNMAQQVMYVVQGGSLSIYDDTIDALEYNPNNDKNPGQISTLIGDFIDVKVVDF